MVLVLNNDKMLSVTQNSNSIFGECNAEEIILYVPKNTFNINVNTGLHVIILKNVEKNNQITLVLNYIEDFNNYHKLVALVTKDLTIEDTVYSIQYLHVNSNTDVVFKSSTISKKLLDAQIRPTSIYINNNSDTYFEEFLLQMDDKIKQFAKITKINADILSEMKALTK